MPEIIDYEEAVRKNHVRRLYEDEGNALNQIVFLNVDGSKTMYTFDFPVKYIDENGNIRDITLEIADSTSQRGAFKSAANSATTIFSAQFADGITLSDSDTEIRLTPILPPVESGTAAIASGNIRNSNSSSVLEAQRIDEKTIAYRYDDVTTVEYSLTYTGFKEDIVVSEYTGQTEYPFRLYTNGMALEEINGSYFLVDDNGDIHATIGNIIIFTADERNNAFGSIVPTTIIENEEYILTIVVDADYLADPNTVYPIRIDPTVEIDYSDGASAIEDITITTNTNYAGSYTSLYVGRRSTEGIARILMRFPGLDLSGLEGSTVTSASVCVRDLMCEGTPLDISCHVFTGNVWDANNATWGSVSPDSYVATALSTNTLSWGTGNALDPAHWYNFDITSAVQGWIDGNYMQSKGILFKASSSVENGSTITNRTFASFNRASYKPSFSVTYTPNGTQLIPNGTYYLNNTETGKYIQKTASNTVAGVSGLLSSIGSTIRWEIQKVSNGYVIRSASDPTKYLAGADSLSLASVSIVTVNDSTLPARCIWTITHASTGGCLVKNVYSNRYLYSSGGYLYTSTSTGETGTSTYNSRVWRIAGTTYYGNTSSNSTRELQDGFTISDLTIDIGKTKSPTINKSPTNAMWVDTKDFIYSYSSGTLASVSFDPQTGKATASNIGISRYTATHKVTGLTYTFTIYIDRYTYELVNFFGFNSDAALLIRDLYNRVDDEYSSSTEKYKAWVTSRLLSEFSYDSSTTYFGLISINKWDDVAGSVTSPNSRKLYFIDTLGYSEAAYDKLNTALVAQHSDTLTSDFTHMQYSLAARLAYELNEDGMLSNIYTLNNDDYVSHLAGWLGDATLLSNGTTSFGNDDYMADLDAENLFREINGGDDSITAINAYYKTLSAGSSNRATIFTSHLNYSTVENKVLSEFGMTLDQVKSTYPDTYDFLMSLKDNLAEIGNY